MSVCPQVHAIEEGRTLLDNLKKSIAYTLAHLWPELLPVFLAIAFSFPLGLPGLIILTIDLVSEQVRARVCSMTDVRLITSVCSGTHVLSIPSAPSYPSIPPSAP